MTPSKRIDYMDQCGKPTVEIYLRTLNASNCVNSSVCLSS